MPQSRYALALHSPTFLRPLHPQAHLPARSGHQPQVESFRGRGGRRRTHIVENAGATHGCARKRKPLRGFERVMCLTWLTASSTAPIDGAPERRLPLTHRRIHGSGSRVISNSMPPYGRRERNPRLRVPSGRSDALGLARTIPRARGKPDEYDGSRHRDQRSDAYER